MDLGNIGSWAPLAVGVISSILGERAGKSKSVGGKLPMDKLLAPLLATAGATGTVAFTQPEILDSVTGVVPLIEQGGKWAVWAFLAHIIIRDLAVLAKAIRGGSQ